MKTEIFALYLPQFHQTKENDEWWGEGFTEWNSVRSAKKLHKNSYQPKVPLNGYYDLSRVEDIRKQAEWAISNGVDGFAIYHYYSNGKLLLDKPVKLLLDTPDIKIGYFFSWANHDWKRTWYGYSMEILRKQEYGSDEQIIHHYEYLSQYFKDPRYKKISNKPVFCIYKPEYIQNFESYHRIWNKLAKEDGFDGIFFIQTLDIEKKKRNTDLFDAAFDFEPGYTIFSRQNKINFILNRVRTFLLKKKILRNTVANVYDYERFASYLGNRVHSDNKQYYGLFTGWDNTPRHKRMGTFFKKFSLQAFETLLDAQYGKAIKEGHELLIVNAWNEWSEGAYMEPDTDLGYGVLETVKKIKNKYNN